MKTLISKRAERTLVAIISIAMVMFSFIPVDAAEKVTESVQSNCDCAKDLIYESLRYSEYVTVAYHRSYYFMQYECKHGKTSAEESKLELHTMARKDMGHLPGTIKHLYEETCSRCGFQRQVTDLCYCDR